MEAGGASSETPRPTYGAILQPTSFGSGNNTGTGDYIGSGAAALRVSGLTTIDGDICANSIGARAASAGSVYIRTGTLSGSGTVDASAGSASGTAGAGGGRIAVVLTHGDTFGSVTLTAHGGDGGGTDMEGAAGTVYIQLASDPDGAGSVYVANDNLTTNKVFTPLPAFATANENLTNTLWIARNQGKVGLVADAEIGSLELETAGYLELAGYTVTLARLIIDGEEVHWGEYQAGDAELGARVTDTVGGGWVIIPSPPLGTVIMIR
jgi:hypothetical protein